MEYRLMVDEYDVFLSYSRSDSSAAHNLLSQLEKKGLRVFRDTDSLRRGELWLEHLQKAVNACASFVLLVGRDGVRRWVGAEAQVALCRHFDPHDDALRLPIFPVLLEEASIDTLPVFLRLFQISRWDGCELLCEDLTQQISSRRSLANDSPVEGCPFVGLNAYRPDQAQLFFGRHKETLDALACFSTRGNSVAVRWLEINGSSGCGKSSIMNAGLLPLIGQGWLWPRTGFENWHQIGPMMPGERPVEMLAEHLARSFSADMGDISKRLNPKRSEDFDDRALTYLLRAWKSNDTHAFLLSIDQFEELFSFSDTRERGRFECLLATALQDVDCPLFVISTVRSDFLERFDELPHLTKTRNQVGKSWTLPLMSSEGLLDAIESPARLASLDVSEVKAAMLAEAEGEPGGLALVENALEWLWQHRANNNLSGDLFVDQGGLAGILSRNADDLLPTKESQRDRALELLFNLTKVDPDGRRHVRQRIPLTKAIQLAGGGKEGEDLVYRLAGMQVRNHGQASGSLRLITITEERPASQPRARWVNLIHDTLIRSRQRKHEMRPFWPTLWDYIGKNTSRAIARDRVRLLTVLIEEAASTWETSKRASDAEWNEDQFQDVIREIKRSGVSMDEVLESETSRAFFGPIDQREIERLLAISEVDFEKPKNSRYGNRWHLPLQHQDRARLGDRLALLGDQRSGVGLREDGLPDIAWRKIAGGTVTIVPGGDGSGRHMGDEDFVTQDTGVFFMAAYPITVRQFRAFVEDCHRDSSWQLPPSFQTSFIEGMPTEHEGRFENCPADSVSWYDAMAFCHWLSARLSESLGSPIEVRLPDEFEWQAAATGGESARIYPWGSDWDPKVEQSRANTSESRLKRSTAVGMYPHGSARMGVFDLAGNVWEWCLNDYDHPEDCSFAEHEHQFRVLRGGAWSGSWLDARCSYRYRRNPSYRNGRVGFRVMCSSHSIDSASDC